MTNSSTWLKTHITCGWVGHLTASSCHRWITFSLLFAALLSWRAESADLVTHRASRWGFTWPCCAAKQPWIMKQRWGMKWQTRGGERKRERETFCTHAGQCALQLYRAAWWQIQKRINQKLLQQEIGLCLESLTTSKRRKNRCFAFVLVNLYIQVCSSSNSKIYIYIYTKRANRWGDLKQLS